MLWMTVNSHQARSFARRTLAALVFACVLATLPACNYIGPMGYLASGDGKVPAAYKLEDGRSTVIFVDDRENLLRNRTMRRTIAQTAEKTLLESSAVAKVVFISSDSIDTVTAADKWGKPMGIAQVGQAVDADTVIYATIDQFTLSTDNVSLSPQATLRVKVVDAVSKQRLFPTGDNEWHITQAIPPRATGEVPKSQSELTVQEQKLAERAGRELAWVFIEHDYVAQENRIKGYAYE